ncbi:MAG: SAM-dependent methyltransferase [Acidobacteriota bacterium]
MADIYLAGSGIRGALQFTRETIQALRVCRVVFVLHDDLMVHDYVRSLCSDVRDVSDLYAGGGPRADVYRAIAERLIGEAGRGQPVALVAHGHPLFLVSASEYALALARERGLTIAILPSVSSFDTVLSDLMIDYGYALQMFDATTLLRLSPRLNANVPTLVFQLTTLLREEVMREEPGPEILEPLVEFLLRVYPSGHRCKIVHSGAHLLEPSTVVDTFLADLASDERVELWRRPTLYVPAVG